MSLEELIKTMIEEFKKTKKLERKIIIWIMILITLLFIVWLIQLINQT